MIKIIDNFLNDTEASIVEKSVTEVHWFLTLEEASVSPYKYLTMKDSNTKEYLQFCHNLLDHRGELVSPNYKYLIDFIKNKLNKTTPVTEFLRMKINLQTQCSFSNEDFYNTPHLDRLGDNENYFNAIYYVNECDGDTYFFNKEKEGYSIVDKISPKKGRLILFSGDTYHAGRHPIKALKRIVINCNFR